MKKKAANPHQVDAVVSTCFNCHHHEVCIIHLKVVEIMRQNLCILNVDNINEIHKGVKSVCLKFND